MIVRIRRKQILKLALSIIAVLYFGAVNAITETNYFIDTFNEDTLSPYWHVSGKSTYVLSVKDSLLNIAYNRTDSSTEWNDEFWIQGIAVNANKNPNISLKVKSTLAFNLAVKPLDANGDNDFLTTTVPGDNKWHKYVFTLSGSLADTITQVYFYFDGGTTNIESGKVQIDSFELGVPYVYTGMLMEVSSSAGQLSNFITEGSAEGQFPAGSITKLKSVVTSANTLIANSLNYTQGYIDTVTNALFDSITNVEKSVNIAVRPLIDSFATFQTVNLYKNLKFIASKHHYLFGQQDATAYGLTGSNGTYWIDPGTGDTSDVKMVTGSNPAMLCQNAYNIAGVAFPNLTAFRNRQFVCYSKGGVNSVCWHVRDPKYNQFNYASLDTPYNVVQAILPGGSYNTWYKNTLYHLALYFKSVRGANGEAVPIIWRQFHEQNGGWFWWGAGHCTVAQFNQLWVYTLEYLRDTCNVHSLIVAIAPNSGDSYKSVYPGSNYFDIFGLDDYPPDGSLATRKAFTASIDTIVNLAATYNKVAALTEFGDFTNDLGIAGFWNKVVLDGIYADTIASKIAYLATWQNASLSGFYTPFPGMEGAASKIPDFLSFYDDTTTIFLNDMLPVYNSLLTNGVQKHSQADWFHSFALDGFSTSFAYWQPGIKTYRIVVDLPDTLTSNNLQPSFIASPVLL